MTYVTEVVDFFLARFPGVALLDPTDYTILAEWEKQEIPLDLVLKSIADAHTDLQNNSGEIKSLADCHARVKVNFREWLKHNRKSE